MKWKSIQDSLESKCPGDKSIVMGRIKQVRKHKNLLFVDLVDYSGQVQLMIEKSKDPVLFETVSKQSKGAYLLAEGDLAMDLRGNPEINTSRLEVIAESNLNINSPWDVNGLDPSYSERLFSFPEIYVSNPQRAAILKIKTSFIATLHQYFQSKGFTKKKPESSIVHD